MEFPPTWRHPLDSDPTARTDEDTVRQYQADIHNYRLLQRAFDHPFELRTVTSKSNGVTSSASPSSSAQDIVDLATAHAFCGFAAILFAVTADFDRTSTNILNSLYPTWFDATKVENNPARYYAQFAFKPVDSHREGCPKKLSKLVEAHQNLTKQIESTFDAADVNDTGAGYAYADDAEHHQHYKLLPTLRDIFVIVDEPFYTKDGALLVVLRQERAESIGTLVGSDKLERLESYGQPVWTARAGLCEIMDLLIM